MKPSVFKFIVTSFIFYYFVNSLCRTPVLPATRCLVLKANEKTIYSIDEATKPTIERKFS
ncbi:hypothetical protein E4T79_02690 [Streptococcus sp. LYSM12]|nr:hypothetical protein E4T79_02690 [Streptococcus sp. LYSM12]